MRIRPESAAPDVPPPSLAEDAATAPVVPWPWHVIVILRPGAAPAAAAPQENAAASAAGDPLGYVIVVRDAGGDLSLTDESLWLREECERDCDQVEAELAGSSAIVCEVRPVSGDRPPAGS